MKLKFEELKASGNLPSPSGVALEIVRLTQIDNISVDDILHPIKADPVLAGRLLKLANSVSYAGDQAIVSLRDAVVRLGFNILPKLAMSLSILDANRTGFCKQFDYQTFWSTALIRALTVQQLSKHCKSIAPEEAFTVGLISKIGQLALAQIYPKEYADCLQSFADQCNERDFCKECEQKSHCVQSAKQKLLEQERACFGIDQNQITLNMLEDWGMPDYVLESVRLFQHEAGEYYLSEFIAPEEKFAAVLTLASMQAEENKTFYTVNYIYRLAEQLGIPVEQFDEITKQVCLESDSWKNLLSLDKHRICNMDSESTQQQSLDMQSASGNGLRISIIEDDRIQLSILSHYLESKGHIVTSLMCTEDNVLEQVILQRPQIVITDYHMQPMDGITLCKTLRASKGGQEVYIIMVTADDDASVLTKAFRSGVNDFINKPINQAELDARLLSASHFIRLLSSHEQESDDIRNYAFQLATDARRLEAMALTDELTNLPNRRYGYTRLDQAWAKHLRDDGGFAILSLDLDLFKQINDIYGHDTGDQVLIHFANILKKTIRTEDVACRMGGEEFIVLLSDVNEDNVSLFGERIREAVELQQPEHLGLTRKITVSVGGAISDLQLDTGGWKDTLRRSDQALYEAKAAGRNTFKLYRKVNKRSYERYAHSAPIRVKKVIGEEIDEFLVYMANLSQTGLFLMCPEELVPNVGDYLELQTTEIEDAQWRAAKVVRVVEKGFGIEFLSGTQ